MFNLSCQQSITVAVSIEAIEFLLSVNLQKMGTGTGKTQCESQCETAPIWNLAKPRAILGSALLRTTKEMRSSSPNKVNLYHPDSKSQANEQQLISINSDSASQS